jgi:16S rRNA (adenine1518-N6/adenine1519-N6)-dimethyltransferase
MSGVIRLRRKETVVPMKSEKALFALVKAAFNQRRKMLRNAVRGLFEPEFLENPIFNKRAEQLSIEDFAELSFHMR